MRSPLPAMTVIVCPHCGTRYQVPAETLGPQGREVQCAHCAKSWLAIPESAAAPAPAAPARDPDQMFDERTERDLDAAFVAEAQAVLAETRARSRRPRRRASIEEIKAAIAPSPRPPESPRVDARIKRLRDKAFARRQSSMTAKLPLARIRRVARRVTLGVLFALIGGGVAFRTEIVRHLPDLAGVYAAMGMEVNTVGLEFRDVHTLLTQRRGASLIEVDARIYGVAPRTVVVPPVVVTLLDAQGASLYEWSVTPEAPDLEPGEVVDFTSQLSSPPAGATRVRLTFSGGRAQSETPIASPIQPQEPAL